MESGIIRVITSMKWKKPCFLILSPTISGVRMRCEMRWALTSSSRRLLSTVRNRALKMFLNAPPWVRVRTIRSGSMIRMDVLPVTDVSVPRTGPPAISSGRRGRERLWTMVYGADTRTSYPRFSMAAQSTL